MSKEWTVELLDAQHENTVISLRNDSFEYLEMFICEGPGKWNKIGTGFLWNSVQIMSMVISGVQIEVEAVPTKSLMTASDWPLAIVTIRTAIERVIGRPL